MAENLLILLGLISFFVNNMKTAVMTIETGLEKGEKRSITAQSYNIERNLVLDWS
jgi:hypothetical protein